MLTSANHGSIATSQCSISKRTATSGGNVAMSPYPMIAALTTAGPTVRMPVNMARNRPLACFPRRSYPIESDMPSASGASMLAFAESEGMNGSTSAPAAIRPAACISNVAGNKRRIARAMRASRATSSRPGEGRSNAASADAAHPTVAIISFQGQGMAQRRGSRPMEMKLNARMLCIAAALCMGAAMLLPLEGAYAAAPGNARALDEHPFALGSAQPEHPDSACTMPAPVDGKVLGIPVVYQGSTMVCEGASLLQALRGKGLTDQSLISFISSMPRTADGNPYNGYAGEWRHNVNGTYQGMMSAPVTSWARAFGSDAADITGSGAAGVRDEIRNGNPVVAWVTYGYASPEFRQMWWGRAVWNGHVIAVDGIREGAYHVVDPVFGSSWIDARTFEAAFNVTGMAVAVR